MTLCFHQPWCHIHHTKALSTLLWSPRTFSPLPYNKKYIYNQALICGVSLLVNLFTTISSWSFCLLCTLPMYFNHTFVMILSSHCFHHILWLVSTSLYSGCYYALHSVLPVASSNGCHTVILDVKLSLHTGTFCYSLGFDRQLCFRQMRPLCHD